jgi:hypothetical protein
VTTSETTIEATNGEMELLGDLEESLRTIHGLQRVLNSKSSRTEVHQTKLTVALRSPSISSEYAPPSDPKAARNRAMRDAYKETVSDSSASSAEDEDEVPVPAGYGDATDPEADIAYSFDARSGPNSGSGVLGYAVQKAMEQFENSATDKLVTDEYLVLDEAGEAVATTKAGRVGKRAKNNAKKITSKASSEELDADLDEEYEFI